MQHFLIFGSGIFYIGGLVALMRVRKVDESAPRAVLIDLFIAYLCSAVLAALEIARDVWDNTHYEHFPLAITNVALPTVFLVGGYSLYRVYERRAEWFRKVSHDDSQDLHQRPTLHDSRGI